MHRIVKTLAFATCVAAASGGCVSRHELKVTLEDERAKTNSQIDAEKKDREAEDKRLQVQMGALRADLADLREKYQTQITMLQNSVRFDVPVTFDTDRAEVSDDQTAALDKFADVARNYYGDATITIEGYADPSGTTAHNERLSRRRADAVRDYLVAKGLDRDRLKPIGYGEDVDRQLVPGAVGDEEGADFNRRVVFVVESTKPIPGQQPTEPQMTRAD